MRESINIISNDIIRLVNLIIFSLALARLVSPGGWIDTTMTIGRLGVFDITRRTFATWRMDVNGLLPADLKDRGARIIARYRLFVCYT